MACNAEEINERPTIKKPKNINNQQKFLSKKFLKRCSFVDGYACWKFISGIAHEFSI